MKQIRYVGDGFITLELENEEGVWSLTPVHHTVDADGITHEQASTQMEEEDDVADRLIATGLFKEVE